MRNVIVFIILLFVTCSNCYAQEKRSCPKVPILNENERASGRARPQDKNARRRSSTTLRTFLSENAVIPLRSRLQLNRNFETASSFEERIIGATFKTLAKAFISTADIDKLKEDGVDELNEMDPEKFAERYFEAYDVLKTLPEELKEIYGFSAEMQKEQVIEIIKSIDREELYKHIDAVPDTVITQQFKKHLNKEKEEGNDGNVVEQVNRLWNKVINKVNGPDR